MMLVSVLFLTLVLAAVPNILWFVAWLVAKCFHYTMPYAPFGWTAFVLVAIAWIVMAYGFFFGRFKLDINKIEYAHKDVPENFDGYKIVHISDLHLSTFDDSPKQLQRFVDSINVQNPDIICFTGDLVSLGVEEAEPYLDILKQLKAGDGVVSILGNHDFIIYRHRSDSTFNRTNAVERLDSLQRNTLGWHLLRNDNYKVERGEEKITIVGVDNKNCSNQGFRTIDMGDLPKAMQGTDGFRILLTHDPSHWRGEVVGKTDIPLTLCGHTHAAQVKIFGWTPASWTFRDTHGRYDENGQTMYINGGLGCTLPIRLGVNAEITVITLRKNNGVQ